MCALSFFNAAHRLILNLPQCVARKVPELCKAYTPGKPDQDVHLRLARLEHIIEIAMPQYASGLQGLSPLDGYDRDHQRSISPSPEEGPHSSSGDQDPSGGTFQSGKWYGNSASGSVAPASVLEQVRVLLYPDHSLELNDYLAAKCCPRF